MINTGYSMMLSKHAAEFATSRVQGVTADHVPSPHTSDNVVQVFNPIVPLVILKKTRPLFN